MAISIITQSAAQAIEISMLVAVPSFLISGWTWPCNSMPWLLRGLSEMLPLTHFLEAIRRIAYLGAGFDIIWPKLLILSLFAIICIPVTMIILSHKYLWTNFTKNSPIGHLS
jgi:ABC-2 type transport system permease protein